ncbi:hypothetical protein HL658_28040 [Azospirillum sp. RWY-5-1]|uniref:Surface antigen domain-containing protein n=1 Tax=Azospirillum oleiclasticum TaxID=2735135 RepID=A0ABX2TL64_9PROT|nr:hypothetical protein [Azospirillum oleiclasticum]NYZ16411.1 hypothetical protein [Azospirillum oleiclasticum]NYZ23873.1 hypothetical protein [Azospirillum oleiclasticum]
MRAHHTLTGIAVAVAMIVPAGWAPALADAFQRVDYRHHHGGWGYHDGGPRVYVGPPVIWLSPPPVVIRPAPPPVVYAPPPPGFVYAPPPAGFVYAPPPPAITAEPAGPVYQARNGQYCREYQSTIRVGGVARPGYGTACQQPDGTWRIVN